MGPFGFPPKNWVPSNEITVLSLCLLLLPEEKIDMLIFLATCTNELPPASSINGVNSRGFQEFPEKLTTHVLIVWFPRKIHSGKLIIAMENPPV